MVINQALTRENSTRIGGQFTNALPNFVPSLLIGCPSSRRGIGKFCLQPLMMELVLRMCAHDFFIVFEKFICRTFETKKTEANK